MPKHAEVARRASPLQWALVAIAVVGAGVAAERWHSLSDAELPPGRVVIVEAPAVQSDLMPLPTIAPPVATAPTSPSAVFVPPAVATAHIAQAYPLLTNVSLQCAAERCTLQGRILPLQAQADLDKRQEMLLGGLAAVLAADGYDLVVPFQMDEVDDNEFQIQATVLPGHSRGS